MVKDIRGEKIDSRIETELNLMVKGFIPKGLCSRPESTSGFLSENTGSQ